MKKNLLVLLVLCVLGQVFGQTALTPKKKVYSPQFEKLMKYGLTNKDEPTFLSTQYGIPVVIHLENSTNGIFYYTTQGKIRGEEKTLKSGTIVAGYSGNKIAIAYFIFDYSEKQWAIAAYEPPAMRQFLFAEKSQFGKDELIEKLIEDQTEIKWIKDEL